jgi:DNA repair exonuclease SbcCD nuclease subunit
MKIAIIADTHFGCRKNSKYFMDVQKQFYEDHFFPYLKENNIKDIIHLGDFFDNRKTVNFETLRHAKDCFINPINEYDMNLLLLIGNHDSYYKSNGDLTSTKLLFNDELNIYVFDSLTRISLGGRSILMVPWIFPIQKEEIAEIIKLSTDDICCGHFEMVGVVQQGTRVSTKGIETNIFSHYSHVFSGHFHKKSQYYVGSPYQMSWSDYGDKKRIVVYDTDTDTTEDVYLGEDIFFKIEYPFPDGKNTPQLSTYNGKFIRVLVKSKNNPADFDSFIKKLESVEPYDIDIKEEHLYIDTIGDNVNDDMDTLSILLSSVDDIDGLTDNDKFVIQSILNQLYERANE